MATQTTGEICCEVFDLENKRTRNFILRSPLKQSNSVSYDVPLTTSAQPRALSVDHTAETKPPEEGSHTWNSTGISASSSEHDNQETNAWSSDYSNSEDEYTILEENAVPVSLR